MSTVYAALLEMKKLLRNLDGCLEKAALHASARKYDPSVLLLSRLAPDMFPLIRQIQAACDQAKFAAARTAGKEPPSHADTEKTTEEARKRIATVVAYLEGFERADFEGVETRTVSLPWWEGKSMTATEYFVEYVTPNFFFHLTTAFAILRHNGVDIGKNDFLGTLPLR
jgi:hypothetical protein